MWQFYLICETTKLDNFNDRWQYIRLRVSYYQFPSILSLNSCSFIRYHRFIIQLSNDMSTDPSKATGKRLVGDVAYAEAALVASHVTPVPGGVGPMTVAMLMRNTVLAARRQLDRLLAPTWPLRPLRITPLSPPPRLVLHVALPTHIFQ